jgi:hypothetical protein
MIEMRADRPAKIVDARQFRPERSEFLLQNS